MGLITVLFRRPTGSLYYAYGYFIRGRGFEEVSVMGLITVSSLLTAREINEFELDIFIQQNEKVRIIQQSNQLFRADNAGGGNGVSI